MVKKLTNKMLGIFTLLMMLMLTSLSAHAVSYYIAGDFTNWGTNKVEMTSDGQGQWVLPAQNVVAGQQFKVVKVDGETETWYGYNNYHVNGAVVGNSSPIDVYTDNGNLDFQVSGIFRFELTEVDNHPRLVISYVPQSVTKKTAVNGTLEVDKTQALPGETVTITATPDPGYYTDVTHIKVEKTIGGGSAQAPGLKDNPEVGQFVDVVAGENNTYTFVMPESPYGAQVSAEFLENTVHNVIIDENIVNGSVTANPTSGEEGDWITLTITPATGYKLKTLSVTYGEGNTITPNEENKFQMPDADVNVTAEFEAIDYKITITPSENGTISVDVDDLTKVHYTDLVTINVTPNADCVVDGITVTTDGGQTVNVTNNQFNMPADNVTITVSIRKLDVSYWVVWGITPENSNSWASENWIPMGQDGANYVLANQNMAAFSEFKIVKKVQDGENDPNPVETWYGAEADYLYWITAQKLGVEIDLFPNGNYKNMYFPKDGTFTFTFTPATANANAVLVVTGKFIYKVTIGETANGTVTANPTSGKQGDEITLTIAPNDGYEVGNISVTYVDGDNTVEVPVTDNKFKMPAGDVTVNVTFNAKTYNITVAESTNGKVTAPESAACGSTVTLIVEPDEDCVLQSLTVTYGENNTPVEVNNNQFTMPAGNVTVTATFRKLDVSYWVVWGVTPENSNSWASENWIKMAQDGANYVLADQNMDAFSEFKIVKKVQDGENDPNPVETWYGVDDSNLYWITVQTLGKDIDLFPNGNYKNMYFPKDGTFTFTFTPATANANAVLVVTGAFEYNITYENAENGTVTGPDKALNGNPVELTVTPADDTYQVGTVSVTYVLDGESKTDEVTKNEETGKYTFTMPAADVTVAVTFTKILANNPLTWNVDNATLEVKVDNAAITSGTEVEEGKAVNVTITQTDVQAAEWEVGKVTIVYGTTTTELTAVEGVYSFNMPAAATEIKVAFTAVEHPINVTPNDHVTVVVNPTTAAAGEEVTITVTPDDDFVVTGVTVNGNAVTENENGTYTFEMPTGANGVTIDVTVAAKIQGVSFTADRNWATYIGAYNLVKPEGVDAYIVTGVSNNAVVIEPVDYIPANVGVLLHGTTGEDLTASLYTVTGQPATFDDNMLVGNATAATAVTAVDYVLYNNNFIRSEAGSVAAHRCYLPGGQVQGAPMMLRIGNNGDVPTAIETLMAEGNVANVMYVNMSGLTSDKPFRGINIAVVTFTDGTTKAIKLVK